MSGPLKKLKIKPAPGASARGTKEASMKPKTDVAKSVDRRGFLRSIGGASVAGAAVAAGMPTPAEASESDADKKKARYRETDHVKAFYRTNRY
jgi:hypothetical protein